MRLYRFVLDGLGNPSNHLTRRRLLLGVAEFLFDGNKMVERKDAILERGRFYDHLCQQSCNEQLAQIGMHSRNK